MSKRAHSDIPTEIDNLELEDDLVQAWRAARKIVALEREDETFSVVAVATAFAGILQYRVGRENGARLDETLENGIERLGEQIRSSIGDDVGLGLSNLTDELKSVAISLDAPVFAEGDCEVLREGFEAIAEAIEQYTPPPPSPSSPRPPR